MTVYLRGTHVRAQTPAARGHNSEPLQPTQVAPLGNAPGSILPDCNKCSDLWLCRWRQRLNYQMGVFVFTFWRAECEAALTGTVDLTEVLTYPRTIAELSALTGKCYGTLRRELHALEIHGINVIAYGEHGEAYYGYGPALPPPHGDNHSRILAELARCEPQIAQAIGDHVHLHVATVRRLLNELAAQERVHIVGKQQFTTAIGYIRQAPLWQRI